MIKRVIFDIDNTLIMWKQEYYNEIKNILDDLNIEYTENDYNDIKKALSQYENEYYTFDRKLMYEYINKYTKKQYPFEFINNVIERWGSCVPEKIEDNIIKTLEYLKNKYELVILTDWYAEPQAKRLEKLGILKYFLDVYSPEQEVKRKPFKEAFDNAIGKNKPEECIMIGDNFERDIKGALKAGLQAIYYTPLKKRDENDNYYTINKLEELNKIL